MKPNKNTYILAIESSCDDTSASVLCNDTVLSNVIANQEIHQKYGGVVPELASRAHQQNIVPVVQQALKQANIDKKELDAIAFTRGPGLMGSLLVGTSFATSMAAALDIPLIDVNHMQAHILAHFIVDDGEGTRCKTQDVRCKTQDVKCKTQDVRCKKQDVRCKTQDVRRKTQDVRCKTQDVRCKTQDVRRKTQDVRCKTQDVRRKTQDVRCKKQDVRCKTQDVRCKTQEMDEITPTKKPSFPFICLTISGGHTQIVKVRSYFDFEVLGETLDDAVGEAFDKSAKALGLPYPGGPLIDKYAQNGNPNAYPFPKPKTKNKLDFSFSGFKTAVMRFIQKNVKENPKFIEENLTDICASIQNGIVSILMDKLKETVKQTNIRQIAIAGGVSANSEIRKRLTQNKYAWKTFIPPMAYTTDNAAMIGIVGYLKHKHGKISNENKIATARLKVDE